MLAKAMRAGAPIEAARAAVVMIHGRGASAESMLEFSTELVPEGSSAYQGIAFIAPQAPGFTWYPYSFLAPLEQNEPYLTTALQTLAEVFKTLEAEGLPAERVLLLGFSQGACLALEFAARHARRYGGIAALSGGLIGPPGTSRRYPGALAGTPAFLGCSDVDPHIPLERVHESTQVLKRMGARVTERIYPGMGHTINEDEIVAVQGLIVSL